MSAKSHTSNPEALQQETLPTLFENVGQDRLIADLKQMILIPSVNPFQGEVRKGFREQEMAEFYCDRMSDLGLEVSTREIVPGRSNVWGVLRGRGGGPSLMLSGHLDTVGIEHYPEALQPRVEGGRVYGRGACDMKDALAGYLEVVRLIRETGIELDGDLILAGIADEEDQMIGSRHLGQHGPWADYGIIGEPSDLVICPAHKGQIGFMVRAHGRAVHSARPEDGANAIEAMSRFMEAFRGYAAELMTRNAHELCGLPRCCASVIRGGTIVSTVPDYCELEVDRRTLPGETREDVLKEYNDILADLNERFPAVRYDIDGPTIEIAPLDVSIDTPVVQAVVQAYRAILGEHESISAFHGGTDAPNFGFPTLIFGSGSLTQAHSNDEYVEIDHFLLATKVYLWSTLKLLARGVFL